VAREALGLVETRGFIAAVEAADAMCKAAHVRLVRYEVTRDALVTIVVRGDVSAVDASVAAGAATAVRLGELLRHHVIPAPDPQLEHPMAGPRRGSGDHSVP
jgi:ethanolamine utilization protein EutM